MADAAISGLGVRLIDPRTIHPVDEVEELPPTRGGFGFVRRRRWTDPLGRVHEVAVKSLPTRIARNGTSAECVPPAPNTGLSAGDHVFLPPVAIAGTISEGHHVLLPPVPSPAEIVASSDPPSFTISRPMPTSYYDGDEVSARCRY